MQRSKIRPMEETRNRRGGNMLFGLSCNYHVPRFVCFKKKCLLYAVDKLVI
jgi:hypothetical protein